MLSMCGGWKLLTEEGKIKGRVVAYNKDGKQWNDIDDPNVEGTCFYEDLRQEADYDSKLHHQLMKVGKTLEKGVNGDTIHEMPRPMINAIVETLRYYGLDDSMAKMAYWDLLVAKYRIWDWLGMAYTGRLEAKKGSRLFGCIENMVKLYIAQKDVGGFCWFLRGHDLDVEEPHKCNDCIKSYKNWIQEIKEQGQNPEEFV